VSLYSSYQMGLELKQANTTVHAQASIFVDVVTLGVATTPYPCHMQCLHDTRMHSLLNRHTYCSCKHKHGSPAVCDLLQW
jgi:hypothetical protein